MRKGVGLLKGAGIPTGRRSTVFVECGCCECYHRADFGGDCREDSERFPDPPAYATRVVELEDDGSEREKGDDDGIEYADPRDEQAERLRGED